MKSKREKDGRITISSIAELSGTSKQVVSSILGSGSGSSTRFSKDTYKKVTEIAEKLNYRPNRTSINLVTGKHGSITVLFKNFYKIPFNSINFLIRRAEDYGRTVNFELIKEKQLPRCVSEDSTDGIILFEDIDQDILESIQKFNIPHVLVNTNLRDQENSITFDEEGMIRAAYEYFSNTGKKSPVMILGDDTAPYAKKARYQTAVSDYSQFGLNKPIIVESSVKKNPVKILESVFLDHPEADCLFVGNFFGRYISFLEKITKKRNMNIAYVLVSFNYINFPTANFSIHQKEVPEMAVNLLNRIIDGKSPDGPITMPYDIAVKQ